MKTTTTARSMRSADLVRCCQSTPRQVRGIRGRHRQRLKFNPVRMAQQLVIPLVVLAAYLAGAILALVGAAMLCVFVLSFIF